MVEALAARPRTSVAGGPGHGTSAGVVPAAEATAAGPARVGVAAGARRVGCCTAAPDRERPARARGYVAVQRADEVAAPSGYFEEVAGAGRGEAGNRLDAMDTLIQLGAVAHRSGDNARARALFEESVAIDRDRGSPRRLRLARQPRPRRAGGGRRRERAGAPPRSLTIKRDVGAGLGIAWVLERFAGLASLEGQWRRALRLAAAADAERARIGSSVPPVWRPQLDGWLGRARAALGEGPADAAWSSGLSLSLEDAASEALTA